ncbi:MAG: hypothetical protein ABSG26_26555 [Bryobacteraceae bacterium]|jgi:hypothetical protein
MNRRLLLPAFLIPSDYLARLLHQGDIGWGVMGAISRTSIVWIGAVLLYKRATDVPHHHQGDDRVHGHRHIPEGEVGMASLVALSASGDLSAAFREYDLVCREDHSLHRGEVAMMNLRSGRMFEANGRRMLLRRRKPRRGPIRLPRYRAWIRRQECRVCGSAGSLGYWHARDLRAVQDFLERISHGVTPPPAEWSAKTWGLNECVGVPGAAGPRAHPSPNTEVPSGPGAPPRGRIRQSPGFRPFTENLAPGGVRNAR